MRIPIKFGVPILLVLVAVGIAAAVLQNLDSLHTTSLLNFWEEMAIAVLAKEADEGLLKEFFFTPVIRYFMTVKGYIDDKRTRTGQTTAYIKYEELNKRWSPKG